MADILINAEKQKFENLAAKQGGWSGWRSFNISAIETNENGKTFTIKATDGKDVVNAEAGQYISVKVKVPNHELQQPQQFKFADAQANNEFKFTVKAEENGTEFSVVNILLENYKVGDKVQVTAPL